MLIFTFTSVHFSSVIAPHLLGFSENTAAVFAPAEMVQINSGKTNSNNSDKSEETVNTTNTASKESEEAREVSAENIDEDSDIYSDITDTPSDIARLMAQTEKTIDGEEKNRQYERRSLCRRRNHCFV
ncbi:MAG: hypothetical protein LUG95_00475 [Clostridiales bacterium]|nr:hypothetical protein [Clostridiales bacterium]